MGVQGSSEESKVGKRLVSRRAVNIGAAWSVPVILTAVAAPTASASPNPERADLVVTGSSADKQPADKFDVKYIVFTLTVTNSGTTAGVVQLLTLTSTGIIGTAEGVPNTVTIAPGTSQDLTVKWRYTGNAATETYTITYTLDGVTAQKSYTR
jgi:hypothetical protein